MATVSGKGFVDNFVLAIFDLPKKKPNVECATKKEAGNINNFHKKIMPNNKLSTHQSHHRSGHTGCSLNIVFFSKKCLYFATSLHIPFASTGLLFAVQKCPTNKRDCTLR